MLYKSERTPFIQGLGTKFELHLNFPGFSIPGRTDHGYGPLAAVIESILLPGTWIRLHEHSNDEIISWVPIGVMRHDDVTVGPLVTDPDHLMVMNAGKSFWHEERVLDTDPYLRMLQIFVRPRELDLQPHIQHGPIKKPVPNEWRHLFGPEGSDAPFFVRNDVHLYDIRLEEGVTVRLPELAAWDAYFYVYSGEVESEELRFGEAEAGLFVSPENASIRAVQPSVVTVFLIDPQAMITRQGTIGR